MIGDLLVKNLDWPGADEIAERLKNAMGSAAGGEQAPNPQLQQAEQAIQTLQGQIQQMQQQLQQAQAVLGIRDALMKRQQEDQKKQALLSELKGKPNTTLDGKSARNPVKDVPKFREPSPLHLSTRGTLEVHDDSRHASATRALLAAYCCLHMSRNRTGRRFCGAVCSCQRGFLRVSSRTRMSGVPLLLLMAVTLSLVSDGAMGAKAVALLGVLAATAAALRALGAGIAGLEPIWIVIVLGGGQKKRKRKLKAEKCLKRW